MSISDNQHVQGLGSETTRRPIHNVLTQAHAANRTPWPIVNGVQVLHDSFVVVRCASSPRAPKRRRPKRVAKKLAQRGGMLRCRGTVQTWYRTWPLALALWGIR